MSQLDFYNQYVHSLVEPLFKMSMRGVKFDEQRRRELRVKYTKELDSLQRKLNKLVGYELNTASGPQMVKWLYEELGLPKEYKRRRGGGKSLTSEEDALQKLYDTHHIEALDVVLQMREKSKVLTTYLNMRLDDDGRFRCMYNIAGTETGRLSSSANGFGAGGNGQNIPDGDVRSLFVTDPGYVFINADLSQAEARVVAYLANDQRLLEVFSSGGDIHTRNAAKMFNKPESKVTKDERFLAKRAVHGLNYGMGPLTFAKECKIDVPTAKKVYNIYFATFPRIKLWHMTTGAQLKKSRVMTTPFGRRRYFFSKWDQQLLKEGLAYVPQSTVAEIVNQAIVRLDNRWGSDVNKQLLLQVHDSILCQVKEAVLKDSIKEIRDAMNIPVTINNKTLKIPVDVKTGYNWRDLK